MKIKHIKLENTSIGVVVGSSATFMETSIGRPLRPGSFDTEQTTSLISFTCVLSRIGERSVALMTATLSARSLVFENCEGLELGYFSVEITRTAHLVS
jgi:hypothetical protein